jgi:hypothetical protein
MSDTPARSRVRTDVLDYPTAWRIQGEGLTHTDPRCSAAQTDGAFLCDCGAVRTEWNRRIREGLTDDQR